MDKRTEIEAQKKKKNKNFISFYFSNLEKYNKLTCKHHFPLIQWNEQARTDTLKLKIFFPRVQFTLVLQYQIK